MYKVGLTGGIASGKSTISRLFEELGITVYDADIISRQLMEPKQPGYKQSIAYFGTGILDEEKKIDRQLLRKTVFRDPKKKKWLEDMLHPLIRKQCRMLLEQTVPGPYVLMVVPLMFESGFNHLVDHVVSIDCPGDVQRQRLVRRDHIDPELAERMIASQLSNRERIEQADSVIDNASDRNPSAEVQHIHAMLTSLSKQTK